MLRNLVWLLLAAAILLVGADLLYAQTQGYVAYTPSGSGEHAIDRGPGFYLAGYKLSLLVLVFLLWVYTTDWISRDGVELGEGIGMPWQVWGPVSVLSFFLVFFLATLNIPFFAAGYPLLVLAWFVPLTIYIVMRNARVTDEKKVLTSSHLKNWFSNLGRRKKKEVKAIHPWEMGPPLEMHATTPLQQQNQAILIEARQSPAFVATKILLADALDNRAEKIMLDYAQDAVAIRYYVDGIWHNAAPLVDIPQPKGPPLKAPPNREVGDMMLAVMKKVANLNIMDRRNRQEGKFRTEIAGSKYDTTLLSQGTQTGERVLATFQLVTKHIPTLEELGMRDGLRDKLKELIGPGASGVVVFASLPQDGLSALWTASLRSTDRLMRDFMSIQDEANLERDIENVELVKYNLKAGETPDKLLPKLLLKQPEVVCIPHVPNGETAAALCNYSLNEDRPHLGLTSTRAKDASEALLRVAALGVPIDLFARSVKGVVFVRLVRKLCELCREAVQPTPELLQRLGIPPGRVQVLYREKQPPPPGQPPPQKKKGEPEVCPACRGLGYRSRTGIYEVLIVDDKIRQALVRQAPVDDIRKLARQGGNRSLQEEGILIMALGTTSLTELQRVMKQ
jgi:type II secretory ATPase GspE/PulE/Tfp pilus assembly ATPase PilB-like protein